MIVKEKLGQIWRSTASWIYLRPDPNRGNLAPMDLQLCHQLLLRLWPQLPRPQRLEHLAGDASNRRYYRALLSESLEWPPSVVLMVLAAEPLKSEEASSAPLPSELPFIAMQRYLQARGLPVPQIYGYFEAEGVLALEDLGGTELEAALANADAQLRGELYRRALGLLVAFQEGTLADADEPCGAFQHGFTPELLRWELEHFREYGLRRELSPKETLVWERARDRIVARVAAIPQILCHRDFQSRNLMLQDGKLRLIDFQDALLGPCTYDLVALLRDSYVELSAGELDALLARYLEMAPPSPWRADAARFKEWFLWNTAQRKLKDSGRFVYIDEVKGNPSFLKHIPASLRYVSHSLRQLPGLGELLTLLEDIVPDFPR